MTILQFLGKIKANLRLEWDHHKKQWRVSIPGATYVLPSAIDKSAGTGHYHPLRVWGPVAAYALYGFVKKIRGAKLRRGGTVHQVPIDLQVIPESLVVAENPDHLLFTGTAPGGITYDEILAKTAEAATVVTPDYPSKAAAVFAKILDLPVPPKPTESVPFPFKKHQKAKMQKQPIPAGLVEAAKHMYADVEKAKFSQEKPMPQPKPKKENIDPFF